MSADLNVGLEEAAKWHDEQALHWRSANWIKTERQKFHERSAAALRSLKTESPSALAASHNSGERLPSSDAAGAGGEPRALPSGQAFWTYDDEYYGACGGHLYYFCIVGATPGPYTTQRHIKAVIDVASDGTLAGVELIDDMPPPPKTGGAA